MRESGIRQQQSPGSPPTEQTTEGGLSPKFECRITKIEGFLEYSEDDGGGDSEASRNVMRLLDLKCITDDDLIPCVVPFGRSIQVLYRCEPFNPLPFQGWKQLTTSSEGVGRASSSSSSLLQVFRILSDSESKSRICAKPPRRNLAQESRGLGKDKRDGTGRNGAARNKRKDGPERVTKSVSCVEREDSEPTLT